MTEAAAEARTRARASRSRSEEINVLKTLALAGADRSAVLLSSREVGERIGASQQAADRYLVSLQNRGLISRTVAGRRPSILLTPAGVDLLRAEHHAYRRIFEGLSRLSFSGIVVSGLGEGRYYLSQPGYQSQFPERLGYSPYPGTLNVRVEGEALRRSAHLRHWGGTRIDGFETSGRTFGGATCIAARLNQRSCHLIRPDRTHYEDVVEFIAAESLREVLGLKDQDPVEIELEET